MLTPVVAERPAQPYIAIRAQVTMQTMDTILQPLGPQVFAWLRERDIPVRDDQFVNAAVVFRNFEVRGQPAVFTSLRLSQ